MEILDRAPTAALTVFTSQSPVQPLLFVLEHLRRLPQFQSRVPLPTSHSTATLATTWPALSHGECTPVRPSPFGLRTRPAGTLKPKQDNKWNMRQLSSAVFQPILWPVLFTPFPLFTPLTSSVCPWPLLSFLSPLFLCPSRTLGHARRSAPPDTSPLRHFGKNQQAINDEQQQKAQRSNRHMSHHNTNQSPPITTRQEGE